MLGAYLAMTVPLTIWLAGRARVAIERVFWALVATASVVVIAATLSRGAWIGLAAGGLVALVLSLGARARAGGGAASPRSARLSRVPAALGAPLSSFVIFL